MMTIIWWYDDHHTVYGFRSWFLVRREQFTGSKNVLSFFTVGKCLTIGGSLSSITAVTFNLMSAGWKDMHTVWSFEWGTCGRWPCWGSRCRGRTLRCRRRGRGRWGGGGCRCRWRRGWVRGGGERQKGWKRGKPWLIRGERILRSSLKRREGGLAQNQGLLTPASQVT